MDDISLEYFIIPGFLFYIFISLIFISKLHKAKKEMKLNIENLYMRNYDEAKRYENSMKALKFECEEQKVFYENQIALNLEKMNTIIRENIMLRKEINILENEMAPLRNDIVILNGSLKRSKKLVATLKDIDMELNNLKKNIELTKFILLKPLLTDFKYNIYHRSLGPLQINNIDGLYINTNKGKFSIAQFGDFLFFNDIYRVNQLTRDFDSYKKRIVEPKEPIVFSSDEFSNRLSAEK